MRLNRPQSLHSNTNWQPLPKNAGTYLSKPFEHPNTNQNSGSNPSILRKSFAKAPSFFLKHGVNGGKQGLFFSQRLHVLSPSCRRCVLHGRSSSRWPNGGSSTAHEGRKKRYDSEGTEAAAFSHHVLLLAAAVSFAFSPSAADEVANTATQKTPAARKHSFDGRFSRRGRK